MKWATPMNPCRSLPIGATPVLLSEGDWRSIQETLHLVSIPGMRESILEGMATDVSALSSEPLW